MRHASHIAFFASFFDFRGPVGVATAQEAKKSEKRNDEPLWLGEFLRSEEENFGGPGKINGWIFIGSKDRS
jgi:hypothetical protein